MTQKLILPDFEDGDEITHNLALEIANTWCKKNNKVLSSPLGFGAAGRAFLLEDETVLKITLSLTEAAFSYDAMYEQPDGFVYTHSVEKANDSIYIILMDYLEQPEFLTSLGIELDNFVDENEINYMENPSIYIDQIETKDVQQLYSTICSIAQNNVLFPMLDIHFGNYGLDIETGELTLFDQVYADVSVSTYLQLIPEANI